MRKKAEILRAFPRYEYSLCFDHARKRLVFYYGTSTVCLLNLKTNHITEISTGQHYGLAEFCFSPNDEYIYAVDRYNKTCANVCRIDTRDNTFKVFFESEHPIDLFRLSPDGSSVFVTNACGKPLDNQSDVIEIDCKTGEVCDKFSIPLAQCKSILFTSNNLKVFGKGYYTHEEFDHDDFLYETLEECDGEFLLYTGEQSKCSTGRIVKAECTFEIGKENSNVSNDFSNSLPSKIEIYDSKRFGERHCNLCYDGELITCIPHYKLLDYEAETTDFPHYALIYYKPQNTACSSYYAKNECEQFALLIGYED